MPRRQPRTTPGHGPPGRESTPAFYASRHRFLTGPGAVAEVDTILLCPGASWSDRPEAADPGWCPVRVGPYTIAVKLTL